MKKGRTDRSTLFPVFVFPCKPRPSDTVARRGSAVPHKRDLHVGAKPDGVSQIPPVVIRIFIDHDIVRVPHPIAAVAEIIRRDRKIEPPEPEAARAASFNSKHVSPAKPAAEASMLPGTI